MHQAAATPESLNQPVKKFPQAQFWIVAGIAIVIASLSARSLSVSAPLCGFTEALRNYIGKLLLAGSVLFVASHTFRVFAGDFTERRERPQLNWFPVVRLATQAKRAGLGTPFERHFWFEKWALLAFFLFALVEITYFGPLTFWRIVDPSHLPAHAGFLHYISALYSARFGTITTPYLFPFSLYILVLWCIWLATLLLFIRSVTADLAAYNRQVALLRHYCVPDSDAGLAGIVDRYKRLTFGVFDFVDSLAKSYSMFFLGMIVAGYFGEDILTCNGLAPVFPGKGSWLTLAFCGLGIITVGYLYCYSLTRSVSLATMSRIGDTLEASPALSQELSSSIELVGSIRAKDGLKTLVGLFTWTGVVAGLQFLKYYFHSPCAAAHAAFPDLIANYVCQIFNVSKC